MKEHQNLNFVGIVEFIEDIPSQDYCSLDIKSGGMGGHSTIQSLGETIAHEYGNDFRKKITYEPPFGIDKRGTERGLYARRYHRLSVSEQDMFEKAVLNALKGKE